MSELRAEEVGKVRSRVVQAFGTNSSMELLDGTSTDVQYLQRQINAAKLTANITTRLLREAIAALNEIA